MSETVTIQKAHGSGPTYTALSTVGGVHKERLQTKDQYDPSDTDYPVKIPTTASFKYSFWSHILLNLAGTFTKINNIKHYSDGAIGFNMGTGGELRRGNRDAGDKGCPVSTDYDQATGSDGDTGDQLELHTYYAGQSTKTVNVASDTSGSPATIDTADHVSASKSKAVVLQVKIASDATHGDQTDETLTFTYDVI